MTTSGRVRSAQQSLPDKHTCNRFELLRNRRIDLGKFGIRRSAFDTWLAGRLTGHRRQRDDAHFIDGEIAHTATNIALRCKQQWTE